MKSPVPLKIVQLAFRAGLAGGVATWAAQLLTLQHPIYAFIAAVIVTDLSPSQSQGLGLRRILATAIGAVCGAVLSQLLGTTPAVAGMSVVVAMLVGYLLGAGDGAKVAGYICGIVVLDHSAEPWIYAGQRFIETILGVVIAWMISYLPIVLHEKQPDD
ncbi:FUSC family protein [Prosthecomicrobium sp. N25]|uniref:FUSC family protein n=1 Tax=Prosthecomicrobium sp. N25 TaxID=3129254 RepID=UPI003077CE65